MKEIIFNSIVETQSFAADFAKTVPMGTVIGLIGDLGTGKTTFSQGFAKGLGIKDKVIQGTNGILNGKVLRFHNEPVRHKTLDLIGDLALLGISIKGHVTAARSGHESNVEFVKMIKKEYKEQLENNIP